MKKESSYLQFSCEPICGNCKFANKTGHTNGKGTPYECAKYINRKPVLVFKHFKCSNNGFYPRLSWIQLLWIKVARLIFTVK